MRVLGVDTSLRSSGVAVVEQRGSALTAVEYGAIRTPSGRPLSECLRRLHEELSSLLDRTRPDQVAVEGVFFCRNVATAVALGEARGVVIALSALRGLPVFEYAPRRVKQAVVGHGNAEKDQVRRMVQAIVRLPSEPGEDAGDALAIAVCHLHNAGRHELLAPASI